MDGSDPVARPGRQGAFWRTTALEDLSRQQWEALCDGCGRCCLHKLRDTETDALSFTDVACRLLDTATARCTDYPNRKRHVPDCLRLTPAKVRRADWLPPTCAYVRVALGRDLPWWHWLKSGDPTLVHRAGIGVAGRVINERDAGSLEHHLADWPGRAPPGALAPRPPAASPRTAASPRAQPRITRRTA